jgi:sialidase-1
MRILSHAVFCQQPGRYIGWPSIARTPSGELLAVFSGDRDQHVCPFGKVFLIRSSDNGVTWSQPREIVNTPLDDRDCGITACADGTLVVTWFNSTYPRETYNKGCKAVTKAEKWPLWEKKLDTLTPAIVDRWTNAPLDNARRGHWIIRSTDNGRTWGDPIAVTPSAPHGAIETADGRLLYLGNNGYNRSEKTSSLVLTESTDKGLTWKEIGRIPMFPTGTAHDDRTPYLAEPHLVEVAPGRLLGMARYEQFIRTPPIPYVSPLWQFDSEDGGRTWTAPRPTPVIGKPPHLLKLPDGRLLVSYGVRHHKPLGIRACLSNDGGKSWDMANEILLRDDAPGGDIGYPATTVCPDGTLVTVYYYPPAEGGLTLLAGTRWVL